MDDQYKIVLFDQYCPTCKHKDLDENKEPCEECLSNPINLYSHRPIKWEEAEE